jgi:hypothetical protein
MKRILDIPSETEIDIRSHSCFPVKINQREIPMAIDMMLKADLVMKISKKVIFKTHACYLEKSPKRYVSPRNQTAAFDES